MFLLPGTKNFRHFLVLLLTLAATPEFGQEPVLILAKVRHDQPPARRTAAARNDSASHLLYSDAFTSPLQYQVAAVKKPDVQNATDFPCNSRLEKQSGSNQRDLFQLVHKRLYADGRIGKWVNVAAGYGQIDGLECGIGKNSLELEHPGCAYLQASFSF
jgi:hypothetical protein